MQSFYIIIQQLGKYAGLQTVVAHYFVCLCLTELIPIIVDVLIRLCSDLYVGLTVDVRE